MIKMKYEYLKDLTSDVAFKAYGKTFEEMLTNSGKALLNIMCEIDKVKPNKNTILNVNGKNKKEILFNFLQALIAEVEIEQLFFSDFKIETINNTSIKAICLGDDVNPNIQKTHVKALTNYLFNLEENEKNFISTVSVDI